ncbi:MAG: hypothetical protein JNK73_08725 [Bacteroidia bacterium]|nr:hypothetical protein [Bacteroidia bacterium]
MTRLQTIVMIIIIGTSHLFGCSCENWPTVKNNIKSGDIVFSAIVISNTVTNDFGSQVVWIGDTTTFPVKLLRYPSRIVKLKMLTLYSGKASSDTITIITPFNNSGCGVDFQVGKDYIVYATYKDEVNISSKFNRQSKSNSTYFAHSCSRTALWTREEHDEINRLVKK